MGALGLYEPDLLDGERVALMSLASSLPFPSCQCELSGQLLSHVRECNGIGVGCESGQNGRFPLELLGLIQSLYLHRHGILNSTDISEVFLGFIANSMGEYSQVILMAGSNSLCLFTQ